MFSERPAGYCLGFRDSGHARRDTVEAGEIGVVVETPQSLCDSSPINKGAENVKGENGKVR